LELGFRVRGGARIRTAALTASRRFSFWGGGGEEETLREKVLKLRDKTRSERSFASEKEFKEVEGVVAEMGFGKELRVRGLAKE
jgi:hypothetical protein